jgi:hypothetical protein
MTKTSGAEADGYDPVGLTNLLAIGLGPSMAATNSYLAHSQSLSILLTNSVQQQNQQAIAGLATTSRSITQLFGNRRKEPLPRADTSGSRIVASSTPEPEVSSFFYEPYHEAPYKEPPYKEPPYTESPPATAVSKPV